MEVLWVKEEEQLRVKEEVEGLPSEQGRRNKADSGEQLGSGQPPL